MSVINQSVKCNFTLKCKRYGTNDMKVDDELH